MLLATILSICRHKYHVACAGYHQPVPHTAAAAGEQQELDFQTEEISPQSSRNDLRCIQLKDSPTLAPEVGHTL